MFGVDTSASTSIRAVEMELSVMLCAALVGIIAMAENTNGGVPRVTGRIDLQRHTRTHGLHA